jgi:hypothetical protein
LSTIYCSRPITCISTAISLPDRDQETHTPNIKLGNLSIVFGLSTQTSHISTFCKQSQSCSCNSCSTHMRAPSQLYSITSKPTSSVFRTMGKPSTHTNILFWNARGIKSKKYEFINYLDANNIPRALISETHLQFSTKFKCPNYITYRSDRLNQRGGGTAILIRRDFYNRSVGFITPDPKWNQ